VINLEVFGKSAAMATVADRLDQLVDVSRVRLVDATRDPASAYFGVAAGLGELDKALGALGVLGANVSMMVVGAVGTLVLQSLLMRMARRQSA
jgi:hypothetical protein